jgi:hypothetical protein
MRSLILILAACLPAHAFAAEPIPDGVADARIAYTSDARGGVAAVELATGNLLWTLADSAHVLAVDAHHLAVWQGAGGAFHVLFLDPTSGKLQARSADIGVPAGVIGAVYGASFTVEARWVGEHLVVDWAAYKGWAGGVRPPPDYRPSRQLGQVDLDATTGRVEVPVVATVPKLPELSIPTRTEWASAPFATATTVGVVTTGSRSEHALRRFDLSGNEDLPATRLPTGNAVRTTPWGDQLVVSQGAPPESLAPDARFVDLYSIDTGALLARVPMSSGLRQPVVAGGVVLGLRQENHSTAVPDPGEPRSLEALDPRTGAVLWRHELAREVFHPPPP